MTTVRTLTASASRAVAIDRVPVRVLSRAELRRMGVDDHTTATHLRARRWREVGRAVVLHTGELSTPERHGAALINCGCRSALAAFTAAEMSGLRGWERPEIHVLVPQGARVRRVDDFEIVVHRRRTWNPAELHPSGNRQRLAPALLMAAATASSPRIGCAILSSGVQQRLTRTADLSAALACLRRLRYRRLLSAAIDDIAMGAHALSEIDFVSLCRRHRLPPPRLQAVRRSPNGLRRYLDAEWTRADGRRVAVEVDGAIHLRPVDWVNDQIRQNELTLQDTLLLRFPAIIIRCDETTVAQQLRRALLLPESGAG